MIITLAGMKGSGKSTTGKLLAQQLGYEYFYMGMRFRQEAQKHNMSIEEFDIYVKEHPEIDVEMDKQAIADLKGKDNIIIDANIGAYFFKNAFKIFFTASLSIRAQRVAKKPRPGENPASEQEIARMLTSRENIVDMRLQKIYGFSMLNESNYDLVVNTSAMTVQEVATHIISEAKARNIQL